MSRTEGLLTRLLTALRNYLGLQREYVMLELTEKLTRLLTALVLGAVLFVIAVIAIVFLGITVATLLSGVLGCAWGAYLIVTVCYLLLALLVYLRRKAWLLEPLARVFATILLKDNTQDEQQSD